MLSRYMCIYCGERNAVEDLCNIGKSSSTLLHQNRKHYDKIEDMKSILSLNITMHPDISLDGDRMIMFGGFSDLYITSVRIIWLEKVAPAHFWPDLAEGVFLRTGRVSSNTNATTLTSYLLLIENEVACLVARIAVLKQRLGELGLYFRQLNLRQPNLIATY